MFLKYLLCCLSLLVLTTSYAAPNWREIMGSPEGSIPADPAQDEVLWRDDLDAAFKLAQQENRPLFITFRCPPCDQCSWFDAVVLRGSPTLTPLYQQFITARITNAAELNLDIFKPQQFQDLDLSWWGYFLSPEGKIYGVYGGKDHISDQTRVSEKGLADTMQRVLAHHYDPRREAWDIDGPAPNLHSTDTPLDLPGADAYFSQRPKLRSQIKSGQCLHCHQVNDILYTQEAQEGLGFAEAALPWPFPENIGLELDLDDNLLVTSVEPGSAAEQAGLKQGDRLVVADGRKLFSNTDFRAVLHRADDAPTEIDVYYNRNGEPAQALIKTDEGWKKTIVHWRKSIYDGVMGATPGFFPIKGPRMGQGQGMSIKPWVKGKESHPAYLAGLRPNMEIVAVDGNRDDLNSREFMTWFRQNYEAGDQVTVTVRHGSRTKDYTYRLPRS